MSDLTVLYFEAFEQEYDADKESWLPIAPEADFPIPTNVTIPDKKILRGYDVVSFYVHASPECSPLSCNGLASEIPTNRYCLLDDFETAKRVAETLEECEPGPYRVISVYEVPA